MLPSIHAALDGNAERTWQRALLLGVQALIVLNVAAVAIETVHELNVEYMQPLARFEWFSVAVFTAEYLLRLSACTENPRFRHPLWGRLRYMLTPMAIVDLMAVLPAYLPLFMGVDMRMLRALRLFRMARLLKLTRYSRALRRLIRAGRQTAPELAMTLFGGAVILLLASTLLYYLERDAQPDAFSSIPAATWWAIATLTTVGYGDVAPVTALGKLTAGVVAVLGIGIIALPTGVLASAFLQPEGEKPAPAACPHCGTSLTLQGAPSSSSHEPSGPGGND